MNALILTQLVNENVRVPASWALDASGDPVATFSPALTAAEQTAYADCVAMAKSPFLSELTFAEYQAIKAFIADDRAWLALTRNGFVNMTETDSRQALFPALSAVIRLVFAMMRQS